MFARFGLGHIADRSQLNARARFVAESFLTPVSTLDALLADVHTNVDAVVRLTNHENSLRCMIPEGEVYRRHGRFARDHCGVREIKIQIYDIEIHFGASLLLLT